MKSIALLRLSLSGIALSCLLSACAVGAGTAETSQAPATGGQTASNETAQTPATDPEYQLLKGDEITVSVFNRGEFSISQRIDSRGMVRIPHIGEIVMANRTVRDAEKFLESTLVEKKLLRSPMVSVGVREYSAREITVLGAMNNPGKYRLPREAASVEIVDLVTNMGGFSAVAHQDKVKITRPLENGEEEVFTVNVEAMINPRKAGSNTPRSFLLYPGDRVYVPVRIF